MQVEQMHIDVEQAIQLVSSNARRKLYPEEIDWILNKMVDRYIATHASGIRERAGAAESLMHTQRLSSLLTFIDRQLYVQEPNILKTVLPYEVHEMLSTELGVVNLCGQPALSSRALVKRHILPLKPSTLLSGWYNQVILRVNASQVFSIQSYATARGVAFTGIDSSDIWYIKDILLAELSKQGYHVHWESYGDKAYPGAIIFDAIPESTIDISIDGVTTVATVESTPLTAYINENPVRYPGRLYFQTNMPQMRTGAFTDTYYRNPLCYLQDNTLTVETSSSFIVRFARIYYVRKPQKIDIHLKNNCELPESVHTDICDLAIEHIKLLRQDPDWERKLKDNIQRTTI
jgi:hypothetical protein